MGETRMLNYWPSALLSLVLLGGICAFLKRLECMEMGEVKAMISILFGFATSCLLLSFIWLIQRKPFNRPWPNQPEFLDSELPSMHPRGRLESLDHGHQYIRDGDSLLTVSTIALSNHEIADEPPGYKDALLNSKPISHCSSINNLTRERCKCGFDNCDSNNNHNLLEEHHRVCLNCSKRIMPSILGGTDQSALKQVAIDLAQGLAMTNYSPLAQNASSRTTGDISGGGGRKFSFNQLDVHQLLILSSSPPKYHELTFIDNNNKLNGATTSR